MLSYSLRTSILALSIATSCSAMASQQAPNKPEGTFPSTQAWLKHTKQGLAPYWMHEAAQGVPVGNFPTFRCDNGELLDVSNVCPELQHGWITPHFGREYTRMKSRQTYAYGVLFHLTGDVKALELAKDGAYYLIDQLKDAKNGGFISFTEDDKPGLKWTQRTSQDQAYALVGLAMYYYLTRDPKVEKALIEQQAFIFDKYKLNDNVGLAWVLEDGDDQSAKQHELVAQLDQINGYMLLVAPLLPEPHKTKWLEDLEWLTQVLVNEYHSDDEQRFYGAIHHKAVKMPNAKHNDFGHTIKAYWMTYLTAQLLDKPDWKTFAKQGMEVTLERAQYNMPFDYVADYFPKEQQEALKGTTIPSWKSRPNSSGASSWEWAELDQAAMTLSMNTGKIKAPLGYTTTGFMNVWVDHKYGGVGLNPKSTKAFHWGNGYHQFEHALIGTLTSGSLNHNPVTLYYAVDDKSLPSFTPYYYQGKVNKTTSLNNGKVQAVSFGDITP